MSNESVEMSELNIYAKISNPKNPCVGGSVALGKLFSWLNDIAKLVVTVLWDVINAVSVP